MEPRIIAALALAIVTASLLFVAYWRVTKERRTQRAAWKSYDKQKRKAREANF